MGEVVQLEIQDGVAMLTLDRPDRLNAWTREMENRYFDLLEHCGADVDVRAIVVTGAGRGFCAGADMDDLQDLGDGGGASPERAGQSAVPSVATHDRQADDRGDQRALRRASGSCRR